VDRHDIAEQVRVEQEPLRHVMEGLRLSTTWQVRGPDASRKLPQYVLSYNTKKGWDSPVSGRPASAPGSPPRTPAVPPC
jgi:hypothetical protein